jgi:hypothetical protein
MYTALLWAFALYVTPCPDGYIDMYEECGGCTQGYSGPAPFMNAWNTYREATTLATLHCCAMLAQDN